MVDTSSVSDDRPEIRVVLDTGVAESLWSGGAGSEWLTRVANGETVASIASLSVAELVRKAPDRRSEIKLIALLSMAESIDLTPAIARRAGLIARQIESDETSAMTSAVVAATALETGLPVACVDTDFYEAMGCQIATVTGLQ